MALQKVEDGEKRNDCLPRSLCLDFETSESVQNSHCSSNSHALRRRPNLLPLLAMCCTLLCYHSVLRESSHRTEILSQPCNSQLGPLHTSVKLYPFMGVLFPDRVSLDTDSVSRVGLSAVCFGSEPFSTQPLTYIIPQCPELITCSSTWHQPSLLRPMRDVALYPILSTLSSLDSISLVLLLVRPRRNYLQTSHDLPTLVNSVGSIVCCVGRVYHFR